MEKQKKKTGVLVNLNIVQHVIIQFTLKKMKKNKMFINFILDKSGSMDAIKQATINGINNYISEMKQNNKDIRFSLTLFNDEIEARIVSCPIKNVKKITDSSYVPYGSTALYDAVVETVERAYANSKEEKDVAHVVVIMTDGEENSSNMHNLDCVKDLIKTLEEKGNWTFVYMGANQDSWLNAKKLSFSRGNVLDWNSTDTGVEHAFRSLISASVNFCSDTTNKTKSFFNKNDT